jgi:hypothetical protein
MTEATLEDRRAKVEALVRRLWAAHEALAGTVSRCPSPADWQALQGKAMSVLAAIRRANELGHRALNGRGQVADAAFEAGLKQIEGDVKGLTTRSTAP